MLNTNATHLDLAALAVAADLTSGVEPARRVVGYVCECNGSRKTSLTPGRCSWGHALRPVVVGTREAWYFEARRGTGLVREREMDLGQWLEPTDAEVADALMQAEYDDITGAGAFETPSPDAAAVAELVESAEGWGLDLNGYDLTTAEGIASLRRDLNRLGGY